MSLEGPLIYLRDTVIGRLTPLLKPTAAPLDGARVGLLDEILSGDWNIDNEMGVTDFISAYGARPNVAILAPIDNETEMDDEGKAQGVLDIRFMIGFKLAITMSSTRPGERMDQDLYLMKMVKELLVRWRPDPANNPAGWGFYPIVVEGSQRYRLPAVSVRIYSFRMMVMRAPTIVGP